MEIKEIPGTKGFLASKCGIILDPDGKARSQYINGDGYKTASVKTTDGRWQTFGVHRLVALSHIPYIGNVESLEVNHKNKNIQMNNFDNLEWVTGHQNIIHSSLFKKEKNSLVLATRLNSCNFKLGDIFEISSAFNKTPEEIWNLICSGESVDEWVFTYQKRRDPIPTQLHNRLQPGERVKDKVPVWIYDLESKNPLKFESYLEAANSFGVSPSHIFQVISKETNIRLFKRRYLISLTNSFPSLSDEKIEELKNPTGKNVLAYDVDLKKYFVFKSASAFIRENDLSKKSVSTTLKQNVIKRSGKWLYTYLSSKNARLLTLAAGVQSA